MKHLERIAVLQRSDFAYEFGGAVRLQAFEIIPVIDVRHGLAVRAVAGDRAAYQPLVTPLASDADPVNVALGYQALYPFATLYIADLDGIEGRAANTDLLTSLETNMPGVAIWVDDGSTSEVGAGRLLQHKNTVAVIGSESLGRASELQRLSERFGGRIALSLDFMGDDFTGPNRLLGDASRWPVRVIVMTLARVGTGNGPDLDRIADIARRAGPERRIYAAGGVRHGADLEAVRAAGASGALVASALHSGALNSAALKQTAGAK